MATSVQLLDISEERDHRLSVRMWALADYGDVRENVVIRDLSTTGFGIETTRRIADGAAIAVTIGALPPLAARIVHRTDGRYGCRLEAPLDAATIDELTRDGPFATVPPVAAPVAVQEPDVVKLPLPVRVAAIAGGAIAGWAALLGIGFAAFG